MTKQIVIAMSLVLASAVARASDDLVPATSEDISQFDRQLSQQLPSNAGFGTQVAAEAKKLRDSDNKSGLGTWVSKQKRKNDQQAVTGGSAAGAVGADHASDRSAAARSDAGSATNGNGNGSSNGNGSDNGHGNGHGRGHH